MCAIPCCVPAAVAVKPVRCCVGNTAALLKTAELVLTFGDAVPCGAPDCLWLPCGSVHEAEGYRNAAPVVRYSAAPEVEAAMEGIQAQNALLSLLLEMGAVRVNELEVAEIAQNA